MKTRRLCALLAFAPGPLVVALDQHVDALDHIAFFIAREGDDALQPKNVRPVGLGDLLYPREEPVRVHFAADQRHGADRRVVDARVQPLVAAMLVMVMAMVVMIVVAMVIMIVMP